MFSALLNIVVDPYAIFGTSNVEKFNAVKPFQANKDRLFKPINLFRENPSVVIFGSSVAQYGINPEYVANVTGGRAYNFGMDGTTVFEIYKALEFSVNNTNITTAIIGWELLSFNGSRPKTLGQFSEARMKLTLASDYYQYLDFQELITLLFSFKTTKDSVRTVFSQSVPPYYSELGYISDPFGQRALTDYNAVFQRSRNTYINLLDGFSEIYPDGTSSIEEFRKVVQLAYNANIDLLMFHSPTHAFFQKGLEESGLDIDYARIKDSLDLVLQEEAEKHGRPAFRILDYSDEVIRNEEDILQIITERMQYWYDSYHFSSRYGNEIVNDLIGAQ